MNRYLSFIIILTLGLFPFGMYSQDFAQVGAKWSYKAVDDFIVVNPDKLVTLESIGEEEVGGKLCKVIQRVNGSCDSSVDELNYVYEEDGIVYWFNSYLEEFTMLYNFNAGPGDSWTIKISDCAIPVKIESVEYLELEGTTLKVLIPENDGQFTSSRIIERIGNERFVFPSKLTVECGVFCDGYYINDGIRCYSDNELDYQNILSGEECFLLSSNEELLSEEAVILYPSITEGPFQVALGDSYQLLISEIRIIDVRGKVVDRIQNINTPAISLSINQKGLYFVEIKVDGAATFMKEVIVR